MRGGRSRSFNYCSACSAKSCSRGRREPVRGGATATTESAADHRDRSNRPLLPRPEPDVGGRPVDHAAAVRGPHRAARQARLSRRDVHRGGLLAPARARRGGHLRRRLHLGAPARATDPRPLRAARHGVRADRLHRVRGAASLAGRRSLARRTARGRADADVLGGSWRSWPRPAGRSARTPCLIRISRRSTTRRCRTS